jgi:hypothetical protein
MADDLTKHVPKPQRRTRITPPNSKIIESRVRIACSKFEWRSPQPLQWRYSQLGSHAAHSWVAWLSNDHKMIICHPAQTEKESYPMHWFWRRSRERVRICAVFANNSAHSWERHSSVAVRLYVLSRVQSWEVTLPMSPGCHGHPHYCLPSFFGLIDGDCFDGAMNSFVRRFGRILMSRFARNRGIYFGVLLYWFVVRTNHVVNHAKTRFVAIS